MSLTWVSSSPHITKYNTVNTIMIDYLIALFPTVILSMFIYGFVYILLILTSVASAVLFELLYELCYRKKFALQDCTSVVTGLIISLTLPPNVPAYVPIIVSMIAIVLIKMCFGGRGASFVSPVAVARILVVVLLSGTFASSFIAPTLTGTSMSSTPLITLIQNGGNIPEFRYLIFGNFAGALGETAIITLLIGGIYLCIRRVIDYKIPLFYLLTVIFMVLIFKGASKVIPYFASSGLVLGAFFIATEFGSIPNSTLGEIVYGLFLGVATCLIWWFGDSVNAVYYAILFGGILNAVLSNYYKPRPIGLRKGDSL